MPPVEDGTLIKHDGVVEPMRLNVGSAQRKIAFRQRTLTFRSSASILTSISTNVPVHRGAAVGLLSHWLSGGHQPASVGVSGSNATKAWSGGGSVTKFEVGEVVDHGSSCSGSWADLRRRAACATPLPH